MADRRTSLPTDKPATESANVSTAQRLMVQFDDLPPDVRAALTSADHLSDQMFDVLCTMHKSGFPQEALLKVIAASNAKGE